MPTTSTCTGNDCLWKKWGWGPTDLACSIAGGISLDIGANIGGYGGYMSLGTNSDRASGQSAWFARFSDPTAGFGAVAGLSLNAGTAGPVEAGFSQTKQLGGVFFGGVTKTTDVNTGESSASYTGRLGLRASAQANSTNNHTYTFEASGRNPDAECN